MKEKFRKGQILVTDDASTLSVDHGHAAILVSTTHTVEHLGKTTSTYSGYYDVGWWQSFDTMKSFNYSNTTTMDNAATYAKDNLQNWKYNALSNRTSASTVNCATLVWKAYDNEGVNIVDSTSGTVLPVNFDQMLYMYDDNVYASYSYLDAVYYFSYNLVDSTNSNVWEVTKRKNDLLLMNSKFVLYDKNHFFDLIPNTNNSILY